MKFKEYLKETTFRDDYRPVKFVIGDGMDTFGKFLDKYSHLSEIVKELAIEDEWSKEDYQNVKKLKASPEALRGVMPIDTVAAKFLESSRKYCVILNMVTEDLEFMVDDTLEFNPYSFQFSNVYLRVNDNIYLIDMEHNVNEVERFSMNDPLISSVTNAALRNETHTISRFQSRVANDGRKMTFKLFAKDIQASIPFL